MPVSSSVIICTHNPNPGYFARVLQSLKQQTTPNTQWQLVVIDNKSDTPVKDLIDLSWHLDAHIIREEKLGLIHARMCGVHAAKHEIIITVDDDTILANDYIENIINIYAANPGLGVVGGKGIPEFLSPAPPWIREFYALLALRDFGDEQIVDQLRAGQKVKEYPKCAPLLIAPRKSCMLKYFEHYLTSSVSKDLGRKGSDLSSGEDNDINLFIYKNGYALGYFPQLYFTHIIPKKRTQTDYLCRLNYKGNITWIKVLNMYNICPWKPIPKWSVSLRKIKAWIIYKAWAAPKNRIRWRGACGMFEALAEING